MNDGSRSQPVGDTRGEWCWGVGEEAIIIGIARQKNGKQNRTWWWMWLNMYAEQKQLNIYPRLM
jgi:hypothetical protein